MKILDLVIDSLPDSRLEIYNKGNYKVNSELPELTDMLRRTTKSVQRKKREKKYSSVNLFLWTLI